MVFLAVWSGAHSPELDERISVAQEEFYARLGSQPDSTSARIDYTTRSRSRTHAYSTKQVVASSIAPWLPAEDVSIVDVLEGNVTCRLQVAELLNQLERSVAYEYFCIWRDLERNYPLRHELRDVARRALTEAELIRNCGDSDALRFVEWITFSDLKAFMTLHGLKPPRGFDAGVARIQSAGSQVVTKLESLILQTVKPEDYFLLTQPSGLTRTMIMDVRVRAQALVALLTRDSEEPVGWG